MNIKQARSNAAKKVVDGLDDFRTYICNNREFIPNFGERRRQWETISTAFVESTINQVVSRRFVLEFGHFGTVIAAIFRPAGPRKQSPGFSLGRSPARNRPVGAA